MTPSLRLLGPLRPRQRRARPHASAILALGALALLTCSTCSNRRAPLAPPAATTTPAPAPPRLEPLLPLPPPTSEAPPTSETPTPGRAPAAGVNGVGGPPNGTTQPLNLPSFFNRLCDLRAGARSDHVRIAWLGDSHTAADLWTGAFRHRLQERYGNGGPGFLHLGWKARAPIRHDGVAFSTRSRWRLEPPTYAQPKRYEDGVLGLGGVRTLPLERDARARVEVSDPALRGEALRWTLSYRPLVATASADVVFGDGRPQRLQIEGAEAGLVGKGAPRQRTFRGSDAFEIRGGRGFQFFGVVAETEAPGLVVDTLGLNGARLITLLAWDEASWVAELSRRRPDLVIVAFGTNESQEPMGDSRRFGNALEGVVERARKAAPQAECLVILPIERGDSAAQERLSVVAASLALRAKALRCALWDARTAMGGPGSLSAWQRESPPRAAGDGVHLTTRGYLALGEALARDVLESATRCEQRPSSPVERPVP